jgi:tetratricopeptide (TPR) repeat protein
MLDEAIEKNPKEPERFLHRSLLYTRLRKQREALADAKCADALEAENVGALLNLADCLSAEGDIAGALSSVNKAIAIDETEAQCYLLRVKLNGQLGNFDKAFGDLDILTKSLPERSSEYRVLRANIYLRKGDPATALQQLSGEKLNFENFNERVECGLVLAAIYCELGTWDKANGTLAQLKALDLSGRQVERWKRAALALSLGDYEQAQADCLANLAMNTSKSYPGDYPYDAIVGTLAYLARGDKSGAELLYAKAMAVSDRPEWPLPVLQYLNGKITVTELAKIASSSDRITDSLTYAAIYDIICGQREQALSRFDKVIARGNCFSTESALVRICRARMKASPPQL